MSVRSIISLLCLVAFAAWCVDPGHSFLRWDGPVDQWNHLLATGVRSTESIFNSGWGSVRLSSPTAGNVTFMQGVDLLLVVLMLGILVALCRATLHLAARSPRLRALLAKAA